MWFSLAGPQASWLPKKEHTDEPWSNVEVTRWPRDPHVEEPIGAPAIFIGYTIHDRRWHDSLRADPEWMHALTDRAELGFAVTLDHSMTRIFSPFYLARLATTAATFDGRANALSQRLDDALGFLAGLPAPSCMPAR